MLLGWKLHVYLEDGLVAHGVITVESSMAEAMDFFKAACVSHLVLRYVQNLKIMVGLSFHGSTPNESIKTKFSSTS